MTTNVIFPLNNKGGVGKTSVLADLGAVLAQRHELGFIDTDYQASLAKTLLRREDLGWQPLSFYDELGVQDVTLIEAGSFNFSDRTSQMRVDVEPTTAKLAEFPVGTLWRSPKRRKRLEKILREDMAGASFLAVDLPPISDPSMILNYSLMPILSTLEDVRLFPLIVSTPDHNVFEEGLKQYDVVKAYLQRRGVPTDRIHPLAVLNRVPVQIDRSERIPRTTTRLGEDASHKFAQLGVLYKADFAGHSSMSNINSKFDYHGSRFRCVVFPDLDVLVQDGRFSLFMNEDPRLSLFPHIANIAESHGYEKPGRQTTIEGMYIHALKGTVSYIEAHSGERPRKNYLKRRTVLSTDEVTSEATIELEAVALAHYSGEEPKVGEMVTNSSYYDSANGWYDVPKTLSDDRLVDAISGAQRELRPSVQVDRSEIKRYLIDNPEGGGATLVDADGRLVCEIRSSPRDSPCELFAIGLPNPGDVCDDYGRRTPANEKLAPFKVLLRHLDFAAK